MGAKKEIVFWRVVALFGIAVEIWTSSRPGSEVGVPEPWDKVVHAFAYAVLVFTLCLGAGKFRRHVLWAVPIAIALFAASDEWHQSFVPGRTCDPFDWLADMTGTGLAVVAWWRARAQA
jgi:VanZ family protein